ncbi:uncharacterized protein LOC143469184 isoform X2 [Clavelina lepadiformis]|uniref:uncharacterized protein LOC143469184 isoform X2 n=1 Tax=Clavelina lepadiformis TaxID=159417 RepID=UPI004042E5A9
MDSKKDNTLRKFFSSAVTRKQKSSFLLTLKQNESDGNKDDVKVWTKDEEKILTTAERKLRKLFDRPTPWRDAGEKRMRFLFQKSHTDFGVTLPVIVSIGTLLVEYKFIDVCTRIWDFCHNTGDDKFSFLSCSTYVYMKKVLWNFSYDCPNFAKAAYKNKSFIERCMSEFDLPELSVDNLKDQKCFDAVKATMAILQNMTRNFHPVSSLIRRNGGLAKILKYYTYNDSGLKNTVIFTVTYCITENQNNKVLADENQFHDDDNGLMTEEQVRTEDEMLIWAIKVALQDLYDLPTPWDDRGGNILYFLLAVNCMYLKNNLPAIVSIGTLMVEYKFIDVCIRIWDFCHNTTDEKFMFISSKTYQNMKYVLWNFSDTCLDLAKAAFQNKTFIRRCMGEFDLPELNVEHLTDESHIKAVEATFNILKNMMRNFLPVSCLIRCKGDLEKISKYQTINELKVGTYVFMALANYISDEENMLMLASENQFLDDDNELLAEDRRRSEDEMMIRAVEVALQDLYDLPTPWDDAGEQILVFLDWIYTKYRKKNSHVIIFIGDLMVEYKYIDVCIRVWDFCHVTKDEKFKFLTCPAYQYMKNLFWNFSDDCLNLAKAVYENKIFIECCMSEFDLTELRIDNLTDEKRIWAVEATVCTLVNMTRHFHPISSLIRCNGGLKKILNYYDHDKLVLKTLVIMAAAHCITEEENDKIMAGKNVISFIVERLKNALNNPICMMSLAHADTSISFSTTELVIGLDKLASNESNKKSIVELNALSLLKRMLGPTSPSEQVQAASNCVWTLSFLPDNKDKIRQEPGLLEAVHRILSDPNTESKIKFSCEGIIFNIERAQPETEEMKKTPRKGKHVMISYQWNKQPIMLKLRDYLKKIGFETWVDVDKMKKSILDEMAHAVEDAEVVVIAMTDDYKNSNNCRTAEYAYKRKKPIIPLLLEPGYDPKGWLGALLGMTLYIDLSNDDDCEEKFHDVEERIMTEIQTPGSITTVDAPDACPPVAQSRTVTSIKSWTSSDVRSWAERNGIADIELVMSNFNGTDLYQLHKLMKKCQDLYYNALRSDHSLTLTQIGRLTEALENLI